MNNKKNESLLTKIRALIYGCGSLPCDILFRPDGKTPSMWLCRDEGDVCVRQYIGGYALWKIPFSLYFKWLDFTDEDRAYSIALLEYIMSVLPQVLRHTKSDSVLGISAKNGAHISKESGGKHAVYRLELSAVCLLPYGGHYRNMTYHLLLRSGEIPLKVGTGFTKFDSNVEGKARSVRYIDEAEYCLYETAAAEKTIMECDSLAGEVYDFISFAPVSSEIDVMSFTADNKPLKQRYSLIRISQSHSELLPQISCTLSPVI